MDCLYVLKSLWQLLFHQALECLVILTFLKCLYYIFSILSPKSLFVISQTPKHVWNMFDFNTISNSYGYLALLVPETLSVVWYFIVDLIPLKVYSYFTLSESKSTVIFICIYCLIISFKLCKFTWTLCGVFPSPNLNSYVVFLSQIRYLLVVILELNSVSEVQYKGMMTDRWWKVSTGIIDVVKSEV